MEHWSVAFDQCCLHAPLSNSPLVGARIELHEGTRWHKERTHRGPPQMVEPARRAFLAAILSATPALLEPVFEACALGPSRTLTRHPDPPDPGVDALPPR